MSLFLACFITKKLKVVFYTILLQLVFLWALFPFSSCFLWGSISHVAIGKTVTWMTLLLLSFHVKMRLNGRGQQNVKLASQELWKLGLFWLHPKVIKLSGFISAFPFLEVPFTLYLSHQSKTWLTHLPESKWSVLPFSQLIWGHYVFEEKFKELNLLRLDIGQYGHNYVACVFEGDKHLWRKAFIT